MLPLIPAQINKTNLQIVKENIIKHSPHPKKVHILAVTKKLSFSALQSAQENNLFHIGENKVQETQQKTQNKKLNSKMQVHLIGHLQSNKAPLAISLYDAIQSIDSLKLLNKINRSAKQQNKKQKIFLQINISKATTQTGFNAGEIIKAAEATTRLRYIKMEGIMSIGAHTSDQKTIQKNFESVRQIQKEIQETINPQCSSLSLGMSQDYILALQAGSTHIRLGTSLFQKNK